jgi:RNA methyltransferase, TrmH family
VFAEGDQIFMMETITSKSNEQLKELRKLHERKQRDRSALFAAEGEDMLSAALAHGWPPRTVFYDPDRFDAGSLPAASTALPVAEAALASASTLGSGSRVIGVWEQRWSELESTAPVAIYLHDVADPGNVGAVLRSALALVPSLVVLSPESADPYGPKAVRASMGAIFGQPVVRASFERARAAIGGQAIALLARSGRPLDELEGGNRRFFCLGSERTGLPDEIVDACDEVVHVPLREGGAESLNVAMTATLCLYESRLHRLSAP